VLAAELLAIAAFAGRPLWPGFSDLRGERRGAPVQAFVRLADEPIRLTTYIREPDYVIVQTLPPELVDVMARA